MNTGDKIREQRKKMGYSADYIAEKLGVSRSTIFRYENGDIEKLPIDILLPISKILNTTPAYLMGWEEKTENTTNISNIDADIAAHLEGKTFSEEDKQQILSFIDFVDSKNK